MALEFPNPRNQRLDPRLYAEAGRPCFYTVCFSPGSKPFAIPEYAAIVQRCLLEQRYKSHCDVVVYCIMPEHLHAIVTPLRDGASSLQFMDRMKGWASRELRLAGWTGPVWRRRSYDHLVREEEDLQQLAAYILANPVRRGLCDEPEQYRWSGMPRSIAPD